MTLRTKFILVFLILTTPTVLLGILASYTLRRISIPLSQDIPQQITKMTRTSGLEHESLYMIYYDEVLTQSARNYAFTGDVAWKNRYLEEAPKLDKVISEAIVQGDDADRENFENVSKINAALVDMETTAISLADNKKLFEAQKILDSDEYEEQKNLYQSMLNEYVDKRDSEYHAAIDGSISILGEISRQTAGATTSGMIQVGLVFVFSAILSIVLAIVFSRLFTKPLKDIRKSI